MTLLALGLNHQTAPLALRELVAFPAERISLALSDLKLRYGKIVQESAILSTCNRTELYVAGPNTDLADYQSRLTEWLSEQHQIDPSQLKSHLYLRHEQDAVRHAFRVASGLDSMVLGEPQILGQMKQAARDAQSAHALGTQLHHLFQRSFAVAKEVRSSTEIGAQSVSLAAAAVRLAQRVFGDLSRSRILFIGAGDMIELCATHFAGQRPQEIVIANRTAERGQQLAQKFNGKAMGLAAIPQRLSDFDVVVSCTASTLPIIGLGMVERALKARRRRPMVLVDLAVPRDIEAEVSHLNDAFLYTIDDLGQLVQSNLESRQAAISQAEAIIETQVQQYMRWIAQRNRVPLIRRLHDRGQQITEQELEKARKALARGENPQQVVEQLAHSLSAKYLHGPTELLRRSEHTAFDEAWVERLLPEPKDSKS